MNKKVLIGVIVAAVLIIGGGAAYFLTRDNDANNAESSNGQSVDQQNAANNGAPNFDPAATANVPFVAVLTGTSNGQAYTANLEHDGKGSSKYSGSNANVPFEMYLINKEYITCSGGMCIKMSGSASSPVNEGTYNFSQEDIANFRSSSTYKGKADCPAGTCDHWQTSKPNETIDFYVASDNKISKASGKIGDTTFEIVFTYKDVMITPPTNVRELST